MLLLLPLLEVRSHVRRVSERASKQAKRWKKRKKPSLLMFR